MDKYDIQAEKLSKVIDIALDAFQKHPSQYFTESDIAEIVKMFSGWKNEINNPKKEFRNLRSLKCYETDILIPFNESAGETVNYFWKIIKEQGIDLKRVDVLAKILKKKRISNRQEYEIAIDTIVSAEQEGRITKEQALLLGELIGNYESKQKGT